MIEVERAPVLGGGPNRSAMPQASFEPGRAHNSYYEPRHFYARKGMLHRFNFVNLWDYRYQDPLA